jgi:arylsulfatase A-like enzyme
MKKILRSIIYSTLIPTQIWGSSVTDKKDLEATKPNVILVLSDDQGYGDLACHGNPWIKTPNIDQLWKSSLRLTDFHVSPTCSPTRSSLMTGRYNDRTGVWHTVTGRSILRENEITLAQIFSDNDYLTGMFGKWHLGDNYPHRPIDKGFQKAVWHMGGAIGNANDYWDNDYFDDYYYDNGVRRQFKGYCTDVWFSEAKKFIESSGKKPFFCYIATNAAHAPLYVEDKYSNPYKGDTLIPSPNFYGMIANIDENIGKLRAWLKGKGLEQNTIFIFMTDNGTASGINFQGQNSKGYNAGMRGKKGSPYDGGHRVPCFIHWPGGNLDKGRDFDGLTAHIDIFPTLAEMCNLKMRNDPKIDGSSQWKFINAKLNQGNAKRTLFVDSQRMEEPELYRQCAVMQKNWRLVNGKELYDMKTDPGQVLDVSEKYPEKVKEMRNLYEEWFKDVFSEYQTRSYIQIGSDKVPSMVLSSHDWMGVVKPDGTRAAKPGEEDIPPFAHNIIRTGPLLNGNWDIEVMRSGKYKIELMRWPKEADRAIREGIPASTIPIPGGQPFGKGNALDIVGARIKIQQCDESVNVTAEMKSADFVITLEKGKTKLHTWFSCANGLTLGAYYVYISELQ